jgi:5-formyltetrahydrofolate cyclo-ligase
MEIDERVELSMRYQAKAVLRKRARALRASIPVPSIAERSRRIAASLGALEQVQRAAHLALFWPIEGRNEVDLRELFDAFSASKSLYYPSVEDETYGDPVDPTEALEPPKPREMTFRRVRDPSAMGERGLGFHDPGPEAEEASGLDVIVVPALAIDPRGHRLGYGAGYYDRALPKFAPPAFTIGVAFDFQLIPEVPITEGDVALDLIVTDQRVIEAGQALIITT